MTPILPNGEPQKGQPPAAHAEPPVSADALRPLRQSPKESLGLSNQGGLLKASLVAAVGFAVLFAGLTFGPYYWDKSQAGAKANAPAPAEKAPSAPAGPTAPAPAAPDPSTSGKLAPSGPAAGKPPSKGDIVDKLGENGAKTAPAKVNPLDKKDDDILKDIK